MKQTITYSAPAKVILSGEHAVVYGKPALVAAINLRLYFTVWIASTTKKDRVINNIAKIVKIHLLKQKISYQNNNYSFKIRSEIPRGVGAGSSAALSVASTAAFIKFYTQKPPEKELVNNIAYRVEKYFHTNPSGVDNTTSTFGGLVFFRKEFEFLRTISLLNFKIPKTIEDNLFLINSGKPIEKTRQMVELVGSLYNQAPKKTELLMMQIEKATKQLAIALIKEDKKLMYQALSDNQVSLEKLGVVSYKTKELLKKLKIFGVGKITGAGGKKEDSGLLLFFANNPSTFASFLTKENIEFIRLKQSTQGVRKEI